MNTLLVLLSLIVVIGLFASLIASRPRGAQLTPLFNVAEGFQPPVRTYLSDAAITTRFLLGKIGSDAAHVALAGVSDIPLGIITDETAAAEEGVALRYLGIQNEGAIGVASAAIAAGDMLVPAASGKLRTLPVASGSYYICGRAVKAAAADGDQVEFIPCFPILRVVP